MIRLVLTYIRTLVLPGWLGPVAAVAIAGGTYWYIDHRARVEERAKVEAAYTIKVAAEKDAAEKHFAERARISAAAINALEAKHAAELAERDRKEDDLESAWRTAVEQNKSLATNVCWPASVVKELRR